jgi:hypothetical protein
MDAGMIGMGNQLTLHQYSTNDVTEEGAATLSAMGDEVISLKTKIENQQPGVDLSNVAHVFDWYKKCYAKEAKDFTSLKTILLTNKAYKGLTHPMKKTDNGKLLPDFNYRYLTEDIPFGLVVLRGIAEILDIPTPVMDKVLLWAQDVSGKEYLVDGKLTGKDMESTRSAQKYGLTTLDQVLGN